MTIRRPAEVFAPGEFLGDELEARGWTAEDFAQILGSPPRLVHEIIEGVRAISPETAASLAVALGTSPELWLNLEAAYQRWCNHADESEKTAQMNPS
ncbi:MAG: HigA family addiction module antitoxin [Dehalococcoidia bacterium]